MARGEQPLCIFVPMNLRHSFLTFLFCLLGFLFGNAQTFSGFVVAGANANQINGDDLAGYNKIGAYAGVGVFNDISDRWRWSLTIAYSQHGSSASARETIRGRSAYDVIKLDYVAVPLALHYMDWLSDDETFYHMEFVGGIEYYRLINSEVTGIFGEDLTDSRPYADNGLGLSIGALYAWSLKWAAGIQYNRGITDAQAIAGEQRQSLEQLSIRLRRTF